MVKSLYKIIQILTWLIFVLIGLLVASFITFPVSSEITNRPTFSLTVADTLVQNTSSPLFRQGKNLFEIHCVKCHSVGKGTKTGLDLQGLLERRTMAWLMPYLRDSRKVLSSSKPIIIKQYLGDKKVTPHHFVWKDNEIKALYNFIEITTKLNRVKSSKND